MVLIFFTLSAAVINGCSAVSNDHAAERMLAPAMILVY